MINFFRIWAKKPVQFALLPAEAVNVSQAIKAA